MISIKMIEIRQSGFIGYSDQRVGERKGKIRRGCYVPEPSGLIDAGGDVARAEAIVDIDNRHV